MNNMNLILHEETNNNKKENWTKLGKTQKILKINSYINSLIEKNKLESKHKEYLTKYLIESLDRKRLTSVKDVIYDIDEGCIKDIPNLIFNNNTNKYTLKRSERKNSTIKSLRKKRNKDIN